MKKTSQSANKKFLSSEQTSAVEKSRLKTLFQEISAPHHIFICHASEDKDGFVRPLANKLKKAGLLVWFDEFSINAGDSLRESIDKGLSHSSYGIVVLSKAFFQKNWTQRELGALYAKNISEDRTTILPIWYKIGHSEILKESPLLADIVGIEYTGDIDEIVRRICAVINLDAPYNQLSGEQRVKLLKRDGSKATWILRRTVQVNKNPLGFMHMRVSTEGKLKLEATAPGVFNRFTNISGTKLAELSYSPPIAPGTVFTQELVFSATDMYCEDENAASLTPTRPYNSYSLTVEVPDRSSIRNVRVVKSIGGKLQELRGLKIDDGKKSYKVCLKNPEVGLLYMLIWERMPQSLRIGRSKPKAGRPSSPRRVNK